MRNFVLCGVLAAALGAVPSAQAATYVAYDQFQISGGAITAANFNFGVSGPTFTGAVSAFDTIAAACPGDAAIACARTGEAGVYKAGTYDSPGTPFYIDGFLNLHPDAGGNMPVVQFVAPTAGEYRFNGSFAIHDVSPTGVDVMAYVGKASQFSSFLGSGAQAFDFNATLAAGDTVSFLIGPAGNWTYDSTGFSLTVSDVAPGGVPEPASWALMIMGFGAAGSLLRRRRALMAA